MASPLRVLVAGCGNMGASHARAYHKMPEFDIVGLVSRGPESRGALSKELGGLPEFSDYYQALAQTKPDAVQHQHLSGHARRLRARRDRGRRPRLLREAARRNRRGGRSRSSTPRSRHKRKLVIGYILRVHPAWTKFVEVARTLGKPLVMRMNLNQQSRGKAWDTHSAPDGLAEPDRRLRRPLRRRDVPDDRRQTRARPRHRRPPERSS